jgi:NAD(P)H-hydrate repair Nnr-like enzyme with NAD(P)H-hydrate epimerase domain
MILLHALESPYDIPGIGIQRGDTMYHLLSDVPGPAGTVELLTFVRRCGGRDAWMQSPGTYREHFDIFGEWAEQARALGAREATGREVGEILAKKRATMQSDAIPVPSITGRQMHVVDDLMESRYTGGEPPPPERAFAVDSLVTLGLAGARLADLARQMLGGTALWRRIAVLCGPNNGYAGAEAASFLADSGALGQAWMIYNQPWPQAYQDEPPPELSRETENLTVYVDRTPTQEELAQADLIIDALLGYEIDGPPSGDIRETIINANAAGVPILSLDLPSGLDANDNGVYEPCIRATATLALGLPKRGLSLVSAQPFIGDVWLADIGFPRRIYKRVGIRVGDIFAAAPLVRLLPAPLVGDALASDVVQWRVG